MPSGEGRPGYINPRGQIIFRLILNQSHIYNDGICSWNNMINIRRFISENSEEKKFTGFMEFISSQEMMPVVDCVVKMHRHDTRKATGDPYLKHLIYTAYLGFLSPEFKQMNDSEKRIYIASNLLHDSIEMKRKKEKYKPRELYNQLVQVGINSNEARKITVISSLLTPFKQKRKNIKKDQWLKIKIKDFKRIINLKEINVDLRDTDIFPELEFRDLSEQEKEVIIKMVRSIKITDEAANIRETVDDVVMGRDGRKKHENLKSLDWRVTDFKARLEIIKKIYPENPLLNQMVADLIGLDSYIL
ncbi:MAG: hypothetical protein US40_C0011G0020 [Candidatus Roizmanbacteria bacterium GW2011_GWC2_37_13]|uniref:HD domain-containing protein n=1 Tax=Candidatus Roizmanbacteria bacterium GW2011_GWC2_37_13 TaxID=1618486 RepID=A0A0G0GGF8_9BACT|nr:MAG: hypothetical protein US38_C0007G0020 [Candidatus Roizmanbacteria bacterium GW2011_GWC1_37_12]KKQ25135.1 MAG: hypothetical protein US40_C0011G0020 [Candidatus Roizmanbacteria bacterium GW2011_GWC2_37_13]